MKLPKKLEKAIDGIGLLIALIVDLIVIPICMITIAPDFLTKIAFVCIGVTIVLFVFRSWAKGDKLAWIVFASVVFFFDFSFSIVVTQVQSQKIDITQDAELKRIDGEILVSQNQITKLQDERTISTRPETIASISADIQTENKKIDRLTIDRKSREKKLETTGGVYITADSVFTSIPDAWTNRRFIPLVIFGLIFLGLQMVVVTSIDSPKKKETGKPIMKVEKPVREKKPRPVITESFDDISDEEYKMVAEYPDGSVRLPEQAARYLRITTEEAEAIHAKLYAGYIYRDGKYVKIGGIK